jgi:hypothetical protein
MVEFLTLLLTLRQPLGYVDPVKMFSWGPVFIEEILSKNALRTL